MYYFIHFKKILLYSCYINHNMKVLLNTKETKSENLLETRAQQQIVIFKVNWKVLFGF